MNAFEERPDFSQDSIKVIREIPLFSGLSSEVIGSLLATAHIRKSPANFTLFVQDDPATHFCIILSGWVKLVRQTPDGFESMINLFGPGESFAEAAIFGEHKFPVTAVTVQEAEILIVPGRPFIRLLRENADISLNMLASMSVHLRQLVQGIEQLNAKSTPQRLASFLVKLARQSEGSVTIDLPLDKILIAARLGMQPETLSRALARLRALGIETQGSQIKIPDIARLGRFSEGDNS